MATYTTTKSTLDIIAKRSTTNEVDRLNNAKYLISLAVSDLQSMGSDYGAFATQLDIDAAAHAGDPAWQAAKAEKDEMIADFQALKVRADTMDAAITGL